VGGGGREMQLISGFTNFGEERSGARPLEKKFSKLILKIWVDEGRISRRPL